VRLLILFYILLYGTIYLPAFNCKGYCSSSTFYCTVLSIFLHSIARVTVPLLHSIVRYYLSSCIQLQGLLFLFYILLYGTIYLPAFNCKGYCAFCFLSTPVCTSSNIHMDSRLRWELQSKAQLGLQRVHVCINDCTLHFTLHTTRVTYRRYMVLFFRVNLTSPITAM
jgi:hypothetical protein